MRSLIGSFKRTGWDTVPKSALWMHAASIGETKSALPLLLKAKQSALSCFVTNRSARALDSVIPSVDAIVATRIAAPNELTAGRFLRSLQPRLGVFVESELWPVLIHKAAKQGVRLGLVNARLSDQSFSRWTSTRASRALLASTLGCFHVLHAQSSKDAERLYSVLGSSAPHILIGNLKFAAAGQHSTGFDEQALREVFGSKPCWAAVSVHPGEIEDLHAAQFLLEKELGSSAPGLIIVPRHPDPTEKRLRRVPGLDAVELNQTGIVEGICNWVASSTGLVLVGGSLPSSVHHGGHNVLEPLAAGCAVIVGPHTFVFKDTLKIADKRDVFVVNNSSEIARVIVHGLSGGPTAHAAQRRRNTVLHNAHASVDEFWEALARPIYCAIGH